MNANTLANVDCDGDRSFPPSSSISENSRTNDALHFIYVDGLKRVPVNARPFPIDDDFFKGEFLPLFRCVDDVPPPEYNVEGRRAYQHFLGKKRMFEFQFQGKLKRKPEGNIWLAIEIDRSIKLGPFQRILIRAALGFVRRTFGGGFQYSLGDDWSDEDKICKGNYEKMHVAFTLHDAVDRLVVSRSGEALPDLGGNIEEDPDIVRRRKKKKIFRGDSVTSSSSLSSGWNTEDTYTLALWSAYIDFMSWRVLNLPGIRPFLLSVLIGNRPLTVSYYSLKKSGSPNIDNDIARPHLRKDINILSQYEIGHVDHTIGGYTQKYIDINKNQNGATMKKS
uniref:Domain of unknown function at the cortex 1 domain-containing protein n=1 Tax=Corethron hystrix TaxID=216773 RepID=A0A7S1BNE1_9STRA|mmetsp:Transcript_35231/g.81519  ORF Transcript_35231/g.81519 Transcript_35231/m.81519 type:complete len:336 (+) Transcript_35231:1058-2065(+)